MPLPADKLPALAGKWANNDRDAAAFLENLMHATRLADDIVDGDAKNPPEQMAQLLYRAFVENGRNRFYQNHAEALAPALANAALMWAASERWHNSKSRNTRTFAFVYREAIEQVYFTVALITGGWAHATAVVDEIQSLMHGDDAETLEAWEAA